MKLNILIAVIMLTGTMAQATVYNCAVNESPKSESSTSKPIGSFSIDTSKGEHARLQVDQRAEVICATMPFRPNLKLLSCVISSLAGNESAGHVDANSNLIMVEHSEKNMLLRVVCIGAH